jgi:hypothetical protein
MDSFKNIFLQFSTFSFLNCCKKTVFLIFHIDNFNFICTSRTLSTVRTSKTKDPSETLSTSSSLNSTVSMVVMAAR